MRTRRIRAKGTPVEKAKQTKSLCFLADDSYLVTSANLPEPRVKLSTAYSYLTIDRAPTGKVKAWSVRDWRCATTKKFDVKTRSVHPNPNSRHLLSIDFDNNGRVWPMPAP